MDLPTVVAEFGPVLTRQILGLTKTFFVGEVIDGCDRDDLPLERMLIMGQGPGDVLDVLILPYVEPEHPYFARGRQYLILKGMAEEQKRLNEPWRPNNPPTWFKEMEARLETLALPEGQVKSHILNYFRQRYGDGRGLLGR